MSGKRLQARAEMMRELYLSAAFFKMQTLGSIRLDREVNVMSDTPIKFSEVNNAPRFFPPREK